MYQIIRYFPIFLLHCQIISYFVLKFSDNVTFIHLFSDNVTNVTPFAAQCNKNLEKVALANSFSKWYTYIKLREGNKKSRT